MKTYKRGQKIYENGTKSHHLKLPVEASEALKARLAQTGESLPQFFLRVLQSEINVNIS